jgi:hypothetical protein
MVALRTLSLPLLGPATAGGFDIRRGGGASWNPGDNRSDG